METRKKVANWGCFFRYEFTTREYGLWRHANVISESELVYTVYTPTLERTISAASMKRGVSNEIPGSELVSLLVVMLYMDSLSPNVAPPL